MQKKRDAQWIQKNEQKSKETADKLFPGENWKEIEERIYLSPRRAVGKKTNFTNELRNAQILRDLGSTVYLISESKIDNNRKFDAIVDGLIMEFKNQSGASLKTFERHFLKSRKQAPNVFINLEKSPLKKQEIISSLIGILISDDFKNKNKFYGGLIILLIKDHYNLIYLNINKLLQKNRT